MANVTMYKCLYLNKKDRESGDILLHDYDDEDSQLGLKELPRVVSAIGIEKEDVESIKTEVSKFNTDWITSHLGDIINSRYYEEMTKKESDRLIEHIKEINNDHDDSYLEEWCLDYFLDRVFLGSCVLLRIISGSLHKNLSERIHCYLSKDSSGYYYIDYSRSLIYHQKSIAYYYTCIRLDRSIIKRLDIFKDISR